MTVGSEAHETDGSPAAVGPYRVLCELGRGSMAAVYLARARGPAGFERLCALKMIHQHLSEQREFVDLFLNEARIAARIHHPNVIAVQDIDLHEGRYYLRLDYVSGETLAQALSRTWNEGKPFPIDAAVQIIAAACDGLHAAHQLTDSSGAPLGVIHRDVGPHNIMIGYDGVVRVMDFGIAKAMDHVSGTKPGTLRGTIAFMSPEHVRGEPLDRRADLFSLGVLLWEMTVGARLFRHRSMAGTMARILAMEVPRPSTLRENYPAALERVVMRALERDRDKRQATARELGDALREVLLSMGIAPSTSHVERFMREVFTERMAQRLAMEREASRIEHSGRIQTALSIEPPPEVLRGVEALLEGDPELADWLAELEAPAGAIPEPSIGEADPTEAAAPLPLRDTGILSRAALPETVVQPVSEEALQDKTEVLRPPSRTSRGLSRPISGLKKKRKIPLSAAWAALVTAAVLAIAFMLSIGLHKGDQAVELAPVTVRLSFVVQPPETVVAVDGVPLKGDLVVPLSPQQYQVEASAEGHRPQRMIVSAEASRRIEINLEPIQKKRGKSGKRRGKSTRAGK